MINITLEVSEQIYNATLQILGTEINMTESNNTAYANISVLQNSTNGLVEFNITAYDDAGNEFNISQSIASANVIIDTVDPKSSNLTIYSTTPTTPHLQPWVADSDHHHRCTEEIFLQPCKFLAL